MACIFFLEESFPTRNAVKSMLELTRRGAFLRETVPWTVGGVAWGARHLRAMLAGSAWGGPGSPGEKAHCCPWDWSTYSFLKSCGPSGWLGDNGVCLSSSSFPLGDTGSVVAVMWASGALESAWHQFSSVA